MNAELKEIWVYLAASPLAGLTLTLLVYQAGLWLYNRSNGNALLNPVLIAIGLLGIMIFETLLSGLRSYVFAHTASRIDVELGARLYRHLLNLPLAWFEARRVGDSVARVRELESIRGFLTGTALTTILGMLPLVQDAFFVSMAVTIMFGLGFATVLTLIFVPVLYAIFFRIPYQGSTEKHKPVTFYEPRTNKE